MPARARARLVALLLLCVTGINQLVAAETATPPNTTSQAIEPDSVDKDYAAELPRTLPTPAADAIETFRIADGFRVELVAAEPLIADPIAMAFDADGTAFVVEMRGYSEDGDANLGLIRHLEDTDHDGTFDRGTDYVSDLSWPTAVACWDGGIFVAAAPDILFCKDTDGDGRADVQRVVFTGFGRQNVQGLLNSFIWGLDNRLYGATSSNGGSILSLLHPQAEPIVSRGNDFAIDPAAMTLSPVSGGGQHGMSFDQWGNRFVSSNSDHLQWVANDLVSSSIPSRRSIAADGPAAEVFRDSPVEPWRIVRTRLRVKGMVGGPVEGGGRAAGYFTGATGVTVYQGDLFPDEFQTATVAFVGDVGSNLVHRKEILDVGLNKIARRIDPGREFLTSTDPWFRPTQFANGPDGALYVLDMYREVIEHPKSLPPMIKRHLDLTSGRQRGRIYRVVPRDAKRPERTLPADATDAQLIEMLGHANGWHRETAARLIAQSGDKRWIPRLLSAARDSGSPQARVRALYCLHTLQADGPNLVAALTHALEDSHPQVRRHAIRLAATSAQRNDAKVIAALRKLIQDDDAHVRLELARAARNFAEQRVAWLSELASQDVSEPDMRLAILDALPKASETASLAQALLGSTRFLASPHADEFLVAVMTRIGRSGNAEALRSCLAALRSSTLSAQSGTSASREVLINALLSATGRTGSELRQLLAMPTDDTFFGDWARTTLSTLEATELTDAERVAAMEKLRIVDFEDAAPALTDALDVHSSPVVRQAALSVLLGYRGSQVDEFLFDALPGIEQSARRLAIGRLASRPVTAKPLLRLASDGELRVADLMPYRRQLLSSSDTEVRELAKQLWANQESRAAVLDQYETVLATAGRPAEGRRVFKEVCSTCHRVDDLGNAIGPDLMPRRNRGARFMLTNILDPNRELDLRYESYTVLLDDGRTLSGMVTKETSAHITLVSADGKHATLPREEISEFFASGQSLMPEGLEQVLDKKKMADLLAFLLSDAWAK